ncbi:MAG: hypothetical protein ACYC9Y_13665 [Candidatus Methylomirabilia bacterium]
MKRLGLLLIAIVMMAGCSKDQDHTADVVGTWVVTYDWNCDGSTGSITLHLRHNGTFIVSNDVPVSGTFILRGNDFMLNPYESSSGGSSGTIYSGKVDGDYMSGSMFSDFTDSTGCWSANRISTTP